MCGIVGYSGNSNGVLPVLEGLSRLEYRGYDSSGISIQKEDGGLSVFKKEGKLHNLKELIEDKQLDSNIAIGHTRWATHGAVNDTNAHPHGNEFFSVVHNGIIENANELKTKLLADGHKFFSETDSEVFLVLLTSLYEKTKNVESSIIETFKQMKGNSAFVIMSQGSRNLYSIKRSAPLVCGHNDDKSDIFMSSDPYALVGFANKIYFPDDEVLCIADHSSGDILSFKNLEGQECNSYKVQSNEIEMETVAKGKYDHFMLKEIFEQPDLINKLSSTYLSDGGVKKLEELKPLFQGNYIHLAACGTALHAGYVIKNFIEKSSQVKVGTDFASEFRYREPLLSKGDIGLFISQSGETADTLACQQMCKEEGLKTLSIVNVEGSTLYRECDENLLIHAGIEIGVASTKAFTQQVLVGLLMAKTISGELKAEELRGEFNLLSERISSILEREKEIANIAKEIYTKSGFIFTGRGEQYPIALEGALKLKEIAYVHAEGYAAGELKHGPISLIDENMVNVAIITPDLYEKTYSNAQEVKARRGIIVAVGQEGNKELLDDSDYFFGIDFIGLKHTKPIVTNIVLQLLSYHIAKLKGTDIDKPRNLAKSVTVE